MAKEPFELPDDQCERMTRSECQGMEMIMASLSNMRYAKDDLEKRLQCIPGGISRMNMLIGQLSSLIRDLCGTITDKQRKHLRNIIDDMKVCLVPKMTPNKVSVVMTPEEAKELINAAQWKCVDCIKEFEESRDCKLCKLLECVVPLDHYSGLSCPYSRAEWEDE